MSQASQTSQTSQASQTSATQVTPATSPARRLGPVRAKINDYVARHQLAWDLVMAAFALVYVGLAFVEDHVSVRVYETWFAPVEIALTAIFFAEFFGRFWAAESRGAYLRHHWIDLVALLPAVRLLRFLRAARFLRIAEVARALEAARLLRLGALVRFLAEIERAGHRVRWIAQHNGVHVFLSFALGIMVVGGAIVWQIEGAARNPEFAQLGNALWWAFATMATVGYGNGPETVAGRVIAAIMMIVGIGCFGLMSATVTTLFIERTHGPETSATELKEMLVQIGQRLDHLEQALAEERGAHATAPEAGPAPAPPPDARSAIPATVPMWLDEPDELPRR